MGRQLRHHAELSSPAAAAEEEGVQDREEVRVGRQRPQCLLGFEAAADALCTVTAWPLQRKRSACPWLPGSASSRDGPHLRGSPRSHAPKLDVGLHSG